MMTRQVAVWKKEVLDSLLGLISKYTVIAVTNLEKVRSSQIQEIRKRLRGSAELLVVKNTILRKAAEQSGKKELVDFANRITGSKMLVFTDMNPFRLIIFLNKNKVRVPAKAGDVATGDIMIPGGNTGLQPGPVISEFGAVKIQTRIESGSIWVARDTIVASEGDVIQAKLASLLSKLGLKPMEAGLTLSSAYDDGIVLGLEDLQFDLEAYRDQIANAARNALGLSVETRYIVPENAKLILAKAFRSALAVSLKAGFPTSENIDKLLGQGYRDMKVVSQRLAAVSREASPPESGSAS
jgi:large subunit ribosomal protein L10